MGGMCDVPQYFYIWPVMIHVSMVRPALKHLPDLPPANEAVVKQVYICLCELGQD